MCECKPEIDARRAENESASAPVLLGTSQQPAAPAPSTTSTQAGSRQLGLVRPAKKARMMM
jgi:hypothetical protein